MSDHRTVERVRTAAALLFLWAVAFAGAPGRVVADTKIDLPLDPAAQVVRALHLWDGATTFGVLQNQAYGYLFPMAPFALLGRLVAEPWVVQRLWWAVLLTIGYLATRRLLAALGIGTPALRHVGALAYALSPRVLSTLGPISSESAPALLAPAVLVPIVLASRGQWAPRRAAALSGLAVLACGGVNATATVLAVVPTGLYLLTRARWWRAPVTWWWTAAVAAASAWWVAPLLLLGRYSPPFLDWIESSDVVTRQVTLLDDLRGTSHWLGHLVTSAGPWWEAGFTLAADPRYVVATAVVAAVGLAGLAARDLPERRFLLLTLTTGVLLLALPHRGALDSPVHSSVQALLDGPLAALRNVHKADPLVRLPLALGFTHALALLASTVSRSPARPVLRTGRGGTRGLRAAADVARPALCVALAAAALATALPALDGRLPSRGSFDAVPKAWSEAGRWLSDHGGEGVTLQVPASNFGEHLWGRPLDDVLRTQTSARTAVRDAVPLTPAGTIRVLDAVERTLQEGDALDDGELAVLRRAGVRFLLLRNDLDTGATAAPPTAFARQAVRRTEGVTLARGFGPTLIDGFGDRVRQVEVYGLEAAPAESRAALVPLDRVASATGASESVLRSGTLASDLEVLDGDRTTTAADIRPGGPRIVTDGYRSRDRSFGGVRGRDVGPPRGAGEAVTDYEPWDGSALRTTAAYDGLTALSATTSLADEATGGGLDPSLRPFSAVDGLSSTAWVGFADRRPELSLTFSEPRSVTGLEVSLLADRVRYGALLGIATHLRVTTDHGAVDVDVAATGRAQRVEGLPAAATRTLRIAVTATDRGSSALVTGLSEVRVPGLVVRETLVVPDAGSEPVDEYRLGSELGGSDGCVEVRGEWMCGEGTRAPEEATGLDRSLPVPASRRYAVTGTLRAAAGTALDALLDEGAPEVVASSRISPAPQVRPGAVVDGDPATAWSPAPSDPRPSIAVQYDAPVTVTGLRLDVRGEWLTGREPVAQVSVDGRSQLVVVQQDGTVPLTAARGRTVSVRLLLGAADAEGEPARGLAVRELTVEGSPPPATPAASLSVPCGGGPALAVGGTLVPTAVTGDRRAAYGVGHLSLRACDPVSLSAPRTRLVLPAWAGFLPDRLVLTATAATESAGQTPTAWSGPGAMRVLRSGPGSLAAEVATGAAALLTLTQNGNPGWQARLDGQPLEPVIVDGWRQAFLVPPGSSGTVEVTFAPDRTYRVALLGGALLLLPLLAAGFAPRGWGSSPSTVRAGGVGRWGRHLGPAGALVVATLLAGVWGLLAASVGVLAALLLRRRSTTAVGVAAAAALVVAGVVQAVVAPGRPGTAWLEGTVRLLCVLAVVLALVGNRTSRGQSPSPDAPATAHSGLRPRRRWAGQQRAGRPRRR